MATSPSEILFLTLDEALLLHHEQIERYGGDPSVRDLGLLQSALAMPQAGFGGQYLHGFPTEMAAAYLFHVVRNHAFVDGNKRTGLAAALAFLKLNNVKYTFKKKAIEELVLSVASGATDKPEVIAYFRKHVGA